MFKETAVCPNGKNENQKPEQCSGQKNEDGVLCNVCAWCDAYKKYVEATVH